MQNTPTVMASLPRAVVEFGARKGLSRERLLASIGVSADELEAREARLPRSAEATLWKVLADALGTHGFGLEFAAQNLGPRAYGVVALRDMTASTLGDSFRRHCRHHRVIKDDVSATILEVPTSATIFLTTPSGRLDASPVMSEAALAPYVVHARAWTGTEVDPEEVRFEHARPADASAYERFFRCPVVFGQSVTSIRFSREVLDLPLVHAQHDLCEYLEGSAEAALARLEPCDLSELVYRAVSERLSSVPGRAKGDVSIASVARALGVGSRTLQRRLKEEGVCYHDVVDRVRHHRALERLHDPDQSLAWISAELGFSDPRAFRRAFARWTGLSPERYRRIHSGSRAA